MQVTRTTTRYAYSGIKRYVQSRQAQLKAIAETSQQGRKELGAAVKTARDFLDRDLEGARERLEQALDADQALLSERVKRAVDRARADLLLTVQRWQRMAEPTRSRQPVVAVASTKAQLA